MASARNKKGTQLNKPSNVEAAVFLKQTCWKNKFVALLTKEKGKTAMNKWENDDSDILQALDIQCI